MSIKLNIITRPIVNEIEQFIIKKIIKNPPIIYAPITNKEIDKKNKNYGNYFALPMILETLVLHFGQVPKGSWPEKSTGACSSAFDCPKSNSVRNSSLSLTTAANGLPMRLRKPCMGPIDRFSISSVTSSSENSRLETTFHIARSHCWHLNFL